MTLTPHQTAVLAWLTPGTHAGGCAQFVAAAGLRDGFWMARLRLTHGAPIIPTDPVAFGQIVRLFGSVPGLQAPAFEVLQTVSEDWARVVDRWPVLLDLYRAEPQWRGQVTPLTAVLMECRGMSAEAIRARYEADRRKDIEREAAEKARAVQASKPPPPKAEKPRDLGPKVPPAQASLFRR